MCAWERVWGKRLLRGKQEEGKEEVVRKVEATHDSPSSFLFQYAESTRAESNMKQGRTVIKQNPCFDPPRPPRPPPTQLPPPPPSTTPAQSPSFSIDAFALHFKLDGRLSTRKACSKYLYKAAFALGTSGGLRYKLLLHTLSCFELVSYRAE